MGWWWMMPQEAKAALLLRSYARASAVTLGRGGPLAEAWWMAEREQWREEERRQSATTPTRREVSFPDPAPELEGADLCAVGLGERMGPRAMDYVDPPMRSLRIPAWVQARDCEVGAEEG